MKIERLRVNQITEPLGYSAAQPRLSFQLESTGKKLKTAQIQIADTADMSHILYDSGARTDISPLCFVPDYAFSGGVRYYWQVTAEADNGDTGKSPVAWFEGGRAESEWTLPWITAPFPKETHPVLFRQFALTKAPQAISSARIYITGLGVFEAYLNGQKTNDEYLMPYYNDYRYWVQYITCDVTDMLQENNCLSVMLGNGWYKGRFGLDGLSELFGDQFRLSAELHVQYQDGQTQVITTDTEWQCIPSPIKESGIYDGEVYDANIPLWDAEGNVSAVAMQNAKPAQCTEPPEGKVAERLSPPLRLHERFAPVQLIQTPKGEQILDFGQELTGWVEFTACADHMPKHTELNLSYSEILQDGCFYRDNLRSAKTEYTYIADGKTRHVRPYFTFYGFRYVKVSGVQLTEANLADFQFVARALYSDLQQTGTIETGNEKINRLIQNTLWGQKGNFVDVPTDCPQRDERMGWTGDAQVFCATASYHMYTPAFFHKYLRDMRFEQEENQGGVPYVVPDVTSVGRRKRGIPEPDVSKNEWGEVGSCAWGDAATVIPWTMYQFYGDAVLLSEHYTNMKQWTDFIIHIDEQFCGGKRLWSTGFHFADWLALDNPDAESRFGRTDCYYVASVYYLYSATLTAKAAAVLGKTEDAAYYHRIAKEVRTAIQQEYITPTGRVAIDTQTALVLAIYFDLVPEQFKEKTADALVEKLKSRNMHLDTGFVGTAYLCKALTKAGKTNEAYTLLLNEDYPSWLYEVNMGATTVWERWNSVLPNGKISDTGMNSLNHYAYGAVAEWMYRTVCGIAPDEQSPGFQKAIIAPVPDARLGSVNASYQSASGTYAVAWEMQDKRVVYQIAIPFTAEARFIVPAGYQMIEANGERITQAEIVLQPGQHQITTEKV